MPDDFTKDDTKDESQQQGAAEDKSKQIEDLKARLGIVTKTRKTQEMLKQAGMKDDFTFTLDKPDAAKPVELPSDEAMMEEAGLAVKPAAKKMNTILTYGGIILVSLLAGIFFGRVFRDRGVENFKTDEAKRILAFFNDAKADLTGQKLMETITAHLEKARNVLSKMQSDSPDVSREQVEADMKSLLEDCRTFRDSKIFFSAETLYPMEIYDARVASEVMKLASLSLKIYNKTSELADGLDRLEAVTGKDEEGAVLQKIFVEPEEVEGTRFLKGSWLEKVGDPENGGAVKMFPVKPYGQEKGFLAESTSILNLDISIVMKDKSRKYRQIILAQIRKDL
ncbi:MAG: hypothetical protein FJ088_14220, partial [Deltaproteobacteria bacterium]|nr:hypothetical protein [Deltaproteobacteria bacterium]